MGLMAASMALGVVGAGVQAMGSIQEGNYRAQVAENNAKIAGYNAQLATESGEIEASNQGLKTRAQIGEQKAAQGASGVDVNSGSAVDVRVASDILGMTDALTIKSNAAKQAYGFLTQQTSLLAEAQQDRTAGKIGAFSSLISGAASVTGEWARYNSQYGMV